MTTLTMQQQIALHFAVENGTSKAQVGRDYGLTAHGVNKVIKEIEAIRETVAKTKKLMKTLKIELDIATAPAISRKPKKVHFVGTVPRSVTLLKKRRADKKSKLFNKYIPVPASKPTTATIEGSFADALIKAGL